MDQGRPQRVELLCFPNWFNWWCLPLTWDDAGSYFQVLLAWCNSQSQTHVKGEQDPDEVRVAAACYDSDGGQHGFLVPHHTGFPPCCWCVLWLLQPAPYRVWCGKVDSAIGHELVTTISLIRFAAATEFWNSRIRQGLWKRGHLARLQSLSVRMEGVKELLGKNDE
jgi:hypothetical protein